MSGVYVDANVLVALFIPDSLSARAGAAVGALSDPIFVSDLTALEVISTIGRVVRNREITERAGRLAVTNFDSWSQAHTWLELHSSDVSAATGYARRFDVNLHGAGAMHIAVALRAGARLLTLDSKMKANARKVGAAVV